ncbi:MAG: hypothetical protein KDD63_16215, partial [Bacteroidetes bacterium]|nr:hypothetical protein [Bacteroidota bacterium]
GVSDTGHANLNVAFFEGGQRVVTAAMLNGFGESDEKGLLAILNIFTPNYTYPPTSPVLPTLVRKIIDGLRATNGTVLTPFGLDTSYNHSGDLSLFLIVASDLLFSRLFGTDVAFGTITLNGTNLNAAQRGHLETSLGLILDAIKVRLNGSTIGTTAIMNAHIDALRAAIVGLSFFDILAPNPIFNSLASQILQYLRANNTAVISPFGIQSTAPAGNLERFMLACSDKLFVTLGPNAVQLNGSNLSANQRTMLHASLDRMITFFQGQIAGTTIGSTVITVPHLTALKNAILGLTMANLNVTSLGSVSLGHLGGTNFQTTGGLDPMRLLGEANAAIGRNFQQKLTAVKARLDKNSWVDIRGCRVGQDAAYLEALQK